MFKLSKLISQKRNGKASAAGRPLRIAYGRINQETNAFSPEISTLEDFHRFHFLQGEALAEAASPRGKEVGELSAAAELTGFVKGMTALGQGQVELVPLFSVWASPGGRLGQEAYESLTGMLQQALREAGQIDGLYLAMHGAMRGPADNPEPEEGFLATAREVIGDKVPFAVSYDLHGQMTAAKVETPDIVVAYHTNPHRDLVRVGHRAAAILLRAARKEVRPVSTWRSLPMVMGGGTTVDLFPTMLPIFMRIKALEKRRGVLAVNLFMVHPFNDSPDLGWSVQVVCDGDQQLAENIADELADRAWSVRKKLPPKFLGASEAIRKTRATRTGRRLGTVCLVDASDVVFAGATGDNTRLLRTVLEEAKDLVSYIPVRDAAAVDALWSKRPNDEVEITLGGTINPPVSEPITIRGTFQSRAETKAAGRSVVVRVGKTHIIITDKPPMILKPSFYKDVGLNPWRADFVVVKSFFHFRIYFLALNRRSFLVKTKGITDFETVTTLKFNDPVYPQSDVDDWRAVDSRRRAIVR